MRAPSPWVTFTLLAFGPLVLGCTGKAGDAQEAAAGTTGSSAGSGQSSGGTSSGAGGSASAGSGTGGSGAAAGNPGAGGTAGAFTLPASCGDATEPYTLTSTDLGATLVPFIDDDGWDGELRTQLPLAVAADGGVYVGFTRDDGGTYSAVIAKVGQAEPLVQEADAAIGGVAVTSDGVAALLFDPNTDTDARRWAAVKRWDNLGAEQFAVDLFRSPNLDDVGTKGGMSTSRFGYVEATNELVPYFGHTQRYDDGVRHEGGYVASVDGSAMKTVLSGWWGSHNLDQRFSTDGTSAHLLGLGDAFPKGIFYSPLEDEPDSHVIYTLAANGSGTVNGQLGGVVDFDDALVATFVTNRSISQDLDPGPWPDPDPVISDQIEAAADSAADLGMLSIPKSGSLPDGDLTPIWLEAQVADGAHLRSVKSARYGTGQLVLVAWAEVSGSRNDEQRNYFTMVVDREGNVCQPKTPLDDSMAFTEGDDIVLRADGTIVWSIEQAGQIRVVTLTP